MAAPYDPRKEVRGTTIGPWPRSILVRTLLSILDNWPSGSGAAAGVIFVNSLESIPPGTPADTLVVVRVAP